MSALISDQEVNKIRVSLISIREVLEELQELAPESPGLRVALEDVATIQAVGGLQLHTMSLFVGKAPASDSFSSNLASEIAAMRGELTACIAEVSALHESISSDVMP